MINFKISTKEYKVFLCSIFCIFIRHIDSYLSLETTINYWTQFGHVSPTDYCVIFEPFSNNNNAHLNFLVRWVSFLLITWKGVCKNEQQSKMKSNKNGTSIPLSLAFIIWLWEKQTRWQYLVAVSRGLTGPEASVRRAGSLLLRLWRRAVRMAQLVGRVVGIKFSFFYNVWNSHRRNFFTPNLPESAQGLWMKVAPGNSIFDRSLQEGEDCRKWEEKLRIAKEAPGRKGKWLVSGLDRLSPDIEARPFLAHRCLGNLV